jgi:hypothetical protein
MKVYRRYNQNKFYHQKDMELILDYLNKHGEILVDESAIEDLYCDFSYEKYRASWMIVDEKMLEDWLNDYSQYY